MISQRIIDKIEEAASLYIEWAALKPQLDNTSVSIHLAVMTEPFLSLVLDGQKTLESRFSQNATAPYRQVAPGDLVFMKAGPIVGCFTVSSVMFYQDWTDGLAHMRREYGAAICAQDDAFWADRATRRYATLLGIGDVRKLPPIIVPKRDMRGWVAIRPGSPSS